MTFNMEIGTMHASGKRHVLPTLVGSGCFALIPNRGGGVSVAFSRSLLRSSSCGLVMRPCGGFGWRPVGAFRFVGHNFDLYTVCACITLNFRTRTGVALPTFFASGVVMRRRSIVALFNGTGPGGGIAIRAS